MAARSGVPAGLSSGLADLASTLQRWQPWRVWQLFVLARGKLLAAGIAYYSFLSLFPALALAAVVFGLLLQGRPQLMAAVARTIDEVLPGVVVTPENPDGLVVLSAPATVTLSITGLVALVTLVFGGLGWVGSLRTGIRAILGAPGYPGTLLTAKLRDLAVFLLLGAAVLLSATLTVVVTEVVQLVPMLLGLPDVGWAITDVGLLVSLVVNTGVVLLLMRVLSGVALPLRLIRRGVLLGGFGLTVLQVAGGALIAWVTRNPLFGSFVAVVGLLFWLNFTAWVLLLSVAWAAIDISDAGASAGDISDAGASAGDISDARASAGDISDARASAGTKPPDAASSPIPDVAAGVLTTRGGVDPASARDRAVHGMPAMSRRGQDRVGILAGAVLGAGAAVSAGVLSRALGRMLPGRRR